MGRQINNFYYSCSRNITGLIKRRRLTVNVALSLNLIFKTPVFVFHLRILPPRTGAPAFSFIGTDKLVLFQGVHLFFKGFDTLDVAK
jgi:hypothetical protein